MTLPLTTSAMRPSWRLLFPRLAIMLAFSSLISACQSISPTAQSTTSTIAATMPASGTSTALQLDLSTRHEYTLDNGLRVIIKEDHRAPVVMTQIWYRVGAADEPADKGGISHLLEHMMFKGTSKVSSDDYERLIAKFGGTNNAFTSYDYTGYYELFPANRLGLALELEADRMVNLEFDEAAFVKEHQVVMEERRQRTDDNPLAKAYESYRQLAMPDSPKGESVIGPMQELASIKLSELEDWYHQWYSPNNATLVIVGDVDADEATELVTRYFADLKPRPVPARPSVRQPDFRGYQQVDSIQAVQVPMLLMGFNTPSLLTVPGDATQAYGLSLAQYVLDGGLSSRLESRLIRGEGLLASVGTSYNLLDRGDGLFLIQATPREGVSLAQAQQAILNQIELLSTAPIADEEISRAKTNTITSLIYAQDSMQGQAQMIGSLQSIGYDDSRLATLPQQLDALGSADIQAAAKTYLVKDNLTVMYVLPPDGHVNDNVTDNGDNPALNPMETN